MTQKGFLYPFPVAMVEFQVEKLYGSFKKSEFGPGFKWTKKTRVVPSGFGVKFGFGAGGDPGENFVHKSGRFRVQNFFEWFEKILLFGKVPF